MTLKVHSLWLAQDDKKKNTAVISSKRGDIVLHRKVSTLPKKGIILEPLCGKIFGPEDHDLLTKKNGSLVALDCSWKQIEPSVGKVMRQTRLQGRMLPLLLAANPVNWGKPGKLSTIEALAAAVYLTGNQGQAIDLLSGFSWGERFLQLNKEPLDEYAAAKSSKELVELQFEFFDIEHLREE